jgi:Ca2+:H+ antiporter
MSKKHSRRHFHILDVLVVFVPVSFALYYLHANVILTFLVVAAAIAGLTHFIAESTAIIARRVSNTISALLNATFGNVVEFFVAFFALREGLVSMVKASIIGSVMVNVLLLIGLSMLSGGLKYKEQKFNRDSAGLYSTMLIVVVVGLAMPSIYSIVVAKPAFSMSIAVSIILGIIYLLSLLYTLFTHKHLFEVERHPEEKEGRWPLRWAVAILLAATVLVSLESSLLVETVTPLIDQLPITQTFMGMVVIALLTNIPEHISAMSFARKNNMTLSLEIGMASALQITLFVVPLLMVVSSIALGSALDLVFTPFELVAVVATAMVANYISSDGVCHWLEGAQLVAVYLIIAIAFFFI